MSITTRLQPCPFCGCSSIAIKNEQPSDLSGGYFIECPDCGASTCLRYACGDDPRPLLAESWNRRAPGQCLHQISEPAAQADAHAVPAGWKLVPITVPRSAFPWVSGGYSADYKASNPRDQRVIVDRAQRTWQNILDGISSPAPALEAPAAPVGSARQFIEWMYSQPEDREPTTAEGALLEFEAHLAAAAPQAPAAPTAVVPDAWQPIETAPKNGRLMLLGYINSCGKWRTTRGQWINQEYIDEYAEDPESMSPGWYETTIEDDDGKCWPIEPTRWQPLPPPPQGFSNDQ